MEGLNHNTVAQIVIVVILNTMSPMDLFVTLEPVSPEYLEKILADYNIEEKDAVKHLFLLEEINEKPPKTG